MRRFFVHSCWPISFEHPNPSSLSDLSDNSVLPPTSVNDHDQQMGCYRGFVCSTVGDIEVMSTHSVVERSGFSHMLEVTPPALY